MLDPCTRIEIVIERAQKHRVTAILESLPVTGYTMVLHAAGSGDRGPRRSDDVTDTDENCVFIIAVEDDALVDRLLQEVKPVLGRFGGICLLSEARSVQH